MIGECRTMLSVFGEVTCTKPDKVSAVVVAGRGSLRSTAIHRATRTSATWRLCPPRRRRPLFSESSDAQDPTAALALTAGPMTNIISRSQLTDVAKNRSIAPVFPDNAAGQIWLPPPRTVVRRRNSTQQLGEVLLEPSSSRPRRG